MGISYAGSIVRHERRVRLLFSEALAAGAFNPSLYAIVCVNDVGADPGISAAIVVPDAPNAVDLALNVDLVAGGIYTISSSAVPGVDATTSPHAIDTVNFGALIAANLDVEQTQDDLAAAVYGVDLVWTGSDFLETSTGDLATVSGVANVQGALQRRLTTDDVLPWDPTYGAQASGYVNGPSTSAQALEGALLRQATADDRVESASVTYVVDDSKPGDVYFPVTITLKGAPQGDPLTINVPSPQSG